MASEDVSDEFLLYEDIRRLKIKILEQTGRIDFDEAEARIALAQIQIRRQETQKLAIQLNQLETKLDIFLSRKNEKENK